MVVRSRSDGQGICRRHQVAAASSMRLGRGNNAGREVEGVDATVGAKAGLNCVTRRVAGAWRFGDGGGGGEGGKSKAKCNARGVQLAGGEEAWAEGSVLCRGDSEEAITTTMAARRRLFSGVPSISGHMRYPARAFPFGPSVPPPLASASRPALASWRRRLQPRALQLDNTITTSPRCHVRRLQDGRQHLRRRAERRCRPVYAVHAFPRHAAWPL